MLACFLPPSPLLTLHLPFLNHLPSLAYLRLPSTLLPYFFLVVSPCCFHLLKPVTLSFLLSPFCSLFPLVSSLPTAAGLLSFHLFLLPFSHTTALLSLPYPTSCAHYLSQSSLCLPPSPPPRCAPRKYRFVARQRYQRANTRCDLRGAIKIKLQRGNLRHPPREVCREWQRCSDEKDDNVDIGDNDDVN